MSQANERQIGGDHYRAEYQHWDFIEENGIGYLEAACTKYVTRWQKKDGLRDLEKSAHYLDKLIELVEAKKRSARGFAGTADLARFLVANELGSSEAAIILLTSTWQNVSSLHLAREILAQLIEKARDIPLQAPIRHFQV